MTISEEFSLKGKIAVVTGGTRGLGFQIAEVLAEAGGELVITSRSKKSAETAAADLANRFGTDTLAIALDVSDYKHIAEAAKHIRRKKGRIDVLVNNAGGGAGNSPTDFLKRDPLDMRALVHVNLVGTLWCCQAFGAMMVQENRGKIINIASVAGIVGRDRRLYHRTGLAQQPVEYAAAKGGVISMTRDLAAYFAPFGIYVNAISPGGFERGQPQAFIEGYSDKTPLARMGRDGIDLRGAALYLATAASDYVTGHNLVVDGGFSTWQ